MTPGKIQFKAACMLLLGTVFWGTSFIVMKALVMAQQSLVPTAGAVFLTSLSLVFSFSFAALILAIWGLRRKWSMTWLEVYEGGGLGVFGGLGLFFQMDGVNYTSAPTAAFLTQCYCVFIPLLVACHKRRLPSWSVGLSTAMVLAGIAILSNFHSKEMRLGRGELETLMASLFFTGQILWLERPIFARNNPGNFSLVMYAAIALIFLPIPLSGENPFRIIGVYQSSAVISFNLILALLCTLVAYTLMNFWQPHVDATKAGLIYCSEPVFTTIFGLFLPAIFSAFASIHYPNESITRNQLLGGGLIVAANLLILMQAARTPKSEDLLA